MPTVGFSGHRGLSAAVEDYARREITRVLRRYPAGQLTGISCLADGADSVFADVVLDLGGRLTVVVPASTYREGLPASHWPHYDRLFGAAADVVRLDNVVSDPAAHMAASRRIVDDSDELIVVWDGEPARGYGGTADVVAYATGRGTPVHVVWPPGATRD